MCVLCIDDIFVDASSVTVAVSVSVVTGDIASAYTIPHVRSPLIKHGLEAFTCTRVRTTVMIT